MSTNKKIQLIEQSRIVFNENGYGKFNLHELAQLLGMSRGHLAYYFKDKDEILKAIVDRMWVELDRDLSSSRNFPSFENLHREVQLYYEYQKRYAFIFLNSSIMSHAYVKERFQTMTNLNIEANKATMMLSLTTGNLKPEPIPGIYSNIAFVVWMITFFWFSQQIIRGDKTTEDGEKMIWSIIVPHFTEKGLAKFKDFFGEAYYNSLGEANGSLNFGSDTF